MKFSQRAGEIIIVVIVIVLNLWLMSSPGGRQVDYQEQQQVEYEPPQ